MSNVIRLRYTEKGIGVNFYNSKDENQFKKIIDSIKPLVSNQVSLRVSDIKWDLDNMKLGHADKAANEFLKDINLQLVA